MLHDSILQQDLVSLLFPTVMLADTQLVKKLDNPDNVKVPLDGKDNLEKLFAELGQSLSL